MLQGIYQIKNNKNNMMYIGSSNNIFKRWNQHIDNLNNKIHHSYKLQNDWLIHNIKDFSFSVLELVINKNNLLHHEQEWIDNFPLEQLYNVMTYTNYKNISVPQEFIDTIHFIDKLDTKTIKLLKNNISITEKKGNLLKLGNNKHDLSKTWFMKNSNTLQQLKNNMLNYFRNIINVRMGQFAWTTFTQYFNTLKFKGSIKGFVPINGILEGESKRNNLCFAANCFPNSFIKNMSKEKINDDKYALSILINWIVNVSDINENINIYLPSQRMENILNDWINN